MRSILVLFFVIVCIYFVSAETDAAKKKEDCNFLKKFKSTSGSFDFLSLGAKFLKKRFGKNPEASQSEAKKPTRLKRSIIADLANDAFENISDRIDNAQRSLQNFDNQVHRGGDLLRNSSYYTRLAGAYVSSQIRRRLSNDQRSSDDLSLNRRKRAAPGRRPARRPNRPSAEQPTSDFSAPLAGGKTAEELFAIVRDRNAEVCLQRVICELSAQPHSYGDDGIKFGTKLLTLNTRVNHPEAKQYRDANEQGKKFNRAPRKCKSLYSRCDYDPKQLIDYGNAILQ